MTLSEAMYAVDPETGCWQWLRGRSPQGYGLVWSRDRQQMVCAHRVFYERHVGSIPAGMFVCHHCDNRACVNPEHLFVGTQTDNMQDAKSKGRLGDRRRRLTPEQVHVLRTDAAAGIKQVDLAKRYGVTPGKVSRILGRSLYRDVG